MHPPHPQPALALTLTRCSSWGAAAANGLSPARNLRFLGTYAWLLLLSCVFSSCKAYFSMR